MAEELFIVKSASSKEDYDFVTKLVTQEHVISTGAHSIAHVGPVLEPGFLIGYLNSERIGHICLIKCDDGSQADSCSGNSVYCISFYFVDKHFRGKGYGLKIWNKMWEMLPKTANISLDAMLFMVPRYEKMGLRQEWLCKQYIVSCSRVVQLFQENSLQSEEIEIKPLSAVTFDTLFEYDSSVFGFSRRDFLKKWITIPESLGWVATNRKDEIVGYAVIRHSVIEKHQVVGPLFCDNTYIARLLLYTAAKAATEEKSAEKLALYTPVGENKEAADMFETEIGCDSTPLELMRMYSKGVPPQVCVKKIVSITSLMIG